MVEGPPGPAGQGRDFGPGRDDGGQPQARVGLGRGFQALGQTALPQPFQDFLQGDEPRLGAGLPDGLQDRPGQCGFVSRIGQPGRLHQPGRFGQPGRIGQVGRVELSGRGSQPGWIGQLGQVGLLSQLGRSGQVGQVGPLRQIGPLRQPDRIKLPGRVGFAWRVHLAASGVSLAAARDLPTSARPSSA